MVLRSAGRCPGPRLPFLRAVSTGKSGTLLWWDSPESTSPAKAELRNSGTVPILSVPIFQEGSFPIIADAIGEDDE